MHLLCICCVPLVLQVALPQDFVPTPFVAAGVALLGCAAGIMVTASHNTKEYNGYKVRRPAVLAWQPVGGTYFLLPIVMVVV